MPFKKGHKINVGRKSPLLGVTRSQEFKDKISKTLKGRMPKNIEQLKAASLGRKMTEKHRATIRKLNTERIVSTETREKRRKSMIGKNAGSKNGMWRGGIKSVVVALRNKLMGTFEYRQWRMDVFTRDNFTCQECCSKRDLQAHHIKRFSQILKEYGIKNGEDALRCAELWNINNGKTLCVKCHKKYPTNIQQEDGCAGQGGQPQPEQPMPEQPM